MKLTEVEHNKVYHRPSCLVIEFDVSAACLNASADIDTMGEFVIEYDN